MRKIVLIAAAVAMMAGGASVQAASAQTASAQTAATSSAPAKRPSFMSRMMTRATNKTTPTAASGTRTTTTHVAAGPNAPIATTAGGKPRTAQSIACSGQANAKGIHGKDREKFMRACKKGA